MTLSYSDIDALCLPLGLRPFGALIAENKTGLPEGTRSLILLGPDGPSFWPIFAHSPEAQDGGPDPVDRWSERVIGGLAETVDATPLYPFGAQPPLPFITWALGTEQAFVSAVGLLVHVDAGLWISYRGALALPYEIDLPPAAAHPCDTCADQPCLTACPPRALTGDGYDIPACHAFLDTADGQSCLSGGCAVRAACPISRAHGRPPEQSAHHMSYFHK